MTLNPGKAPREGTPVAADVQGGTAEDVRYLLHTLDEFIAFGENMNPDIGPLFGRDAARIARAWRACLDDAEERDTLRKAAEELTDLLITSRAFLNDDELRAAAYKVRSRLSAVAAPREANPWENVDETHD